MKKMLFLYKPACINRQSVVE